MLCLLMSSSATTAAAAALLFGTPLLRPDSIFTFPHPELLPLLICPLPMYSASASAPSLSSSLKGSGGRDFGLLMPLVLTTEEGAALELDDDVVDPVVRVGGPGEYMAAADPGREDGIANVSGSM